VESKSGLSSLALDEVIAAHGIDAAALRLDDFSGHLAYRKEFLIGLIERAMGKPVARSQEMVNPKELAAQYEDAAFLDEDDPDQQDDAAEAV